MSGTLLVIGEYDKSTETALNQINTVQKDKEENISSQFSLEICGIVILTDNQETIKKIIGDLNIGEIKRNMYIPRYIKDEGVYNYEEIISIIEHRQPDNILIDYKTKLGHKLPSNIPVYEMNRQNTVHTINAKKIPNNPFKEESTSPSTP